MQYHDVIKIGHILGIMDKTNFHEWIDRLKNLLFIVLKYKHLISLQVAKINDGSYDKANRGSGFKVMTRNKQKNMIVHVETIGLQKHSARRVYSNLCSHASTKTCVA